MKKAVVFFIGLVMLLSFMVGSVSAATPLNATVDKLMGVSYRWGGTTAKGFDCSGFTMYVFNKLDIDLPHSSKGQAQEGTFVSKSDLQPGDLVFFNTDGRGISHVGVYLGDGVFAHAASDDGVVKSRLNESYYAKRYITARRVM